MWEGRCYFDGIPDEVHHKVAASGRVPSYKAIAMAILNNDHTLKSIGFSGKHSKYYDQLKAEEIRSRSKQLQLI